jgi:2-polyprenyl-3-methyl-5-hydroxy-6-metoxy-1,4-benzoquinol methylase
MKPTSWTQNQQRHFDDATPAYLVMYGAETPFQEEMTRQLLTLAQVREQEQVLDIGCGVGRLTIPLLRAGCKVTGLDVSRPTLDTLVRRVNELGMSDRFLPLCLPVENLDYQKKFDLVTGRGILHHLQDPLPVLRQVRAALSPNGRAVFLDPNPLQPLWFPFVLLHPTLSLPMERYLWRGTPNRIQQLLNQAGLIPQSFHFLGLVPPPLWDRLPKMAVLETWLESIPLLRQLSLYWMVLCRPQKEE